MIKSKNGMNTIIEGIIIFDESGDAEIQYIENLFTVPEEDLEQTIENVINRTNDYIICEEFEGCIVSNFQL